MNNDLQIELSEWGDSLCTAVDNSEIDETLDFEPLVRYVIHRYCENREHYQKAVTKLFDDMNKVDITVLQERGGKDNNDLTLLDYYQENMDKVDSFGRYRR